MVYAKEFFDLQFSFAERVQALSGISLERALFEYTNFYVRFGLGREFDCENETWCAYLAGLRDADDPREWTYRFYLRDPEATTAPPLVATFGCFSYGFLKEGVVRLHFVNADDAGSPLGSERVERRRAELKLLFEHLKATAGESATVQGLYNRDAYRRLFPPAYAASSRVVRGRFRGMPLWGQFLNYCGQINAAMSDPFLNALVKQASLSDLDACFPFPAIAMEGQASEFYGFYGV